MATKLKKKNKDNVVQFKPQLKEGYSVVVKEATSDPDNEECDIGGWQGRIIHIEDEGNGHSLIRARKKINCTSFSLIRMQGIIPRRINLVSFNI